MGKTKKKRIYHRRTPEEMIADLEAELAALRAKVKDSSGVSPEAVSEERERLGLTRAQYAELIGISVPTVFNWEHGKSRPRAAQLEKWREVKGISKRDAYARLGLQDTDRAKFSADAVRAERERLGLSAADYGELVGVSQLTIYSWEHGRTEPRRKALEQWLSVFGISEGDAYGRLGLELEATGGFSGEAVAEERARLGLSAALYAQLVGVSHLTIYAWERGETKPRQAALEKWLAVKGISEKAAYEQLGISSEDRSGFSPEAVMAERDRLELSAADYGTLVGVSGLTIYNWEKGKTSPRQAQLEKWLAVKGIGKREAWRRVDL